jgi:Kef-type K+ transport system membrane component KefB
MFKIFENMNIGQDLEYILIFSLILILPKIFLRFRIPSGVTAVIVGMVFNYLDHDLTSNQLFKFLALIGITSLFLFAGLEVDSKELKERKSYLSKYLIKFSVVIILLALLFIFTFGYSWRIGFLLALGIFTPSAGFILSSLHAYDINDKDESWIKSKAISKEIVSIAILFIVLQGSNFLNFISTIVFFFLCYLILPQIIAAFFKFIQPYAPNTETSFLVTLSLIMGVVTKELGTYYIIGAFMVGLIGNRFLTKIRTDINEESLLNSLSSFFSVFLPFYFFHVGLSIDYTQITERVLILSLAGFFIFTPFRMFLIHYGFFKFDNEEPARNYYKVSLSLMPTLVFGLIVSKLIITEAPQYSEAGYALVVYTILTSVLPALFSTIGRKRGIIF